MRASIRSPRLTGILRRGAYPKALGIPEREIDENIGAAIFHARNRS